MTRSATTHGDFFGRNISDEDKKIEEGIALLVRREKDGKKIFKCWNFHEFDHYASKCPKREKKYKGKFKPIRDRERIFCMQMKVKNLMRKVKVKVMMNWYL